MLDKFFVDFLYSVGDFLKTERPQNGFVDTVAGILLSDSPRNVSLNRLEIVADAAFAVDVAESARDSFFDVVFVNQADTPGRADRPGAERQPGEYRRGREVLAIRSKKCERVFVVPDK